MRRRRIAVPLAACALLAAGVSAGPAHARRPKKEPKVDPATRVALVQLRISGDAPAELRTQLEQSISRGLSDVKLAAVPNEQVRAALAGTELLDCTSTACLQEMAQRLEATRFLRAGLETTGASYSVELELMTSGGATTRKSGACEVCTISELNELVARLTGELITAPDAAPVEVSIVSRPPGAALQVDGKPIGPAPFSGKLKPGQHVVTALLGGHEEAEKIIEVRAGDEAQRFEIILERAEQPEPPPPPPPSRPFRTWKWVAAGGAGVALVGGAVLIAVDGKQTCDKQPTQLECPERLNTLPGGLLTVGIGVAAGAASAWMFIRDDRDRREGLGRGGVQPRLSFTKGGAIAGLRWAF